jgi:hypothetical protein
MQRIAIVRCRLRRGTLFAPFAGRSRGAETFPIYGIASSLDRLDAQCELFPAQQVLIHAR